MNLRHFRDHLLIELNNLPDLRSQEIQISRIAKDDLFVANDLLLSRVITLLNQVIRVQQSFDTDHLNTILSLVVDTLSFRIAWTRPTKSRYRATLS